MVAAAPASSGDTGAVVAHEVRLLEGPNLYFRRPAVKVVLDVSAVLMAGSEELAAATASTGVRGRPGPPGSQSRQRFAARLAERLLRLLARAMGTTRLGVRSRPGEGVEEVVVAFVWRRRGPARVAAEALPHLVSAVLRGEDPTDRITRAAEVALATPIGDPPLLRTPRIPVVSVTGTNGKTTTTRMLANIAMSAGRRAAWSSTDGVFVQGELVESGDYSGPAGARAVLDAPGVQIGILETARGGLLLKGMGVTANDVSIVTNVAEDHLGLHGIHTVDQLAEVKAIITRVTSPRGWTVLNGEDPRVWAMRHGSPGRAWVFALDAETPAVRESLADGGRATTVIDGWVSVLSPGRAPHRVVRLSDLPATMAGLARHNVANALAAMTGALAIGLPEEAVVEGMRGFTPDADLNPGRLNTFSVPTDDGGTATVIVDLAHNEDGLTALLDVADGLRSPGARVMVSAGMVGDRTDEQIESVGEIAGRRADLVAVAHKEKYLRGRTTEEIDALLATGLGHVGVVPLGPYPTEVESVEALAERAADGDVIAVMCHAQRSEMYAWVADRGGTPDDADRIRAKVLRARGEHEAEDEIAALWDLEDDAERVHRAAALAARFPDDPRLVFEHASALDAIGREDDAVPLYHLSLAGGLREPYRHRCQVQLASSLRVLGRHTEAVTVVDEVAAAYPDSLGVAAVRALVHHDAGDPTGALAGLLGTVAATSADPDVARYRTAIAGYAAALAGTRTD
ncbi:tetratricopeptide repeat protein [Nostocoides sp. F2B08]|nr:tetratricopeptide repeat protein [Tetrasphaera sp. F2B08]